MRHLVARTRPVALHPKPPPTARRSAFPASGTFFRFCSLVRGWFSSRTNPSRWVHANTCQFTQVDDSAAGQLRGNNFIRIIVRWPVCVLRRPHNPVALIHSWAWFVDLVETRCFYMAQQIWLVKLNARRGLNPPSRRVDTSIPRSVTGRLVSSQTGSRTNLVGTSMS